VCGVLASAQHSKWGMMHKKPTPCHFDRPEQQTGCTCTQTNEPTPAPLSLLGVFPAFSPTRGTLILGFEQATKYTVLDQDGNTVGFRFLDFQGLLAPLAHLLTCRDSHHAALPVAV
jgi:hypothetical protein